MPIPVIIYVDVDDTLVRSVGAKRIPITAVIEHVKKLKAEGAVLYCWSTGGREYAKQSAEEVGLADCFSASYPSRTWSLTTKSSRTGDVSRGFFRIPAEANAWKVMRDVLR